MANKVEGRSLLERISGPSQERQSSSKGPNPSKKTKAVNTGKKRSLEHVEGSEAPTSTPWFNNVKIDDNWSRQRILHEEITAFVELLRPRAQEVQARQLLISLISSVIRGRWWNATIHTFGSVVYDLVLPGGDIDLVIEFPDVRAQPAVKRRLFELSALMKNAQITDRVQVITHAKVPVISFETSASLGSFSFDISIRSAEDSGIKAIPIVSGYLDTLPASRTLILLMKCFLSQKGLNSAASGSLSSYAVINMCINFLQVNPMNRSTEILASPTDQASLGTLLLDLLEYYSRTFPYESSYISVAEGKVLSKESKGWAASAQPHRLSIECLVNQENDISKGCGKLRQIRGELEEAFNVLHDSTIDRNASLLGQMIRIPDKMINDRQQLCRDVDCGAFQTAVSAAKSSRRENHGYRRREPEPIYRSNPSTYRPRDSHEQGFHGNRRRNGYEPYPRGAR